MKKEIKAKKVKESHKEPITDKLLSEFGDAVEAISHELDNRIEMIETYAENEIEVVKSKVIKKHKTD